MKKNSLNARSFQASVATVACVALASGCSTDKESQSIAASDPKPGIAQSPKTGKGDAEAKNPEHGNAEVLPDGGGVGQSPVDGQDNEAQGQKPAAPGSEVVFTPNPAGQQGPCDAVWGARDSKRLIQDAMRSGTASDVAAAIDKAKAARGTKVGCPQADVPYAPLNFKVPSLSELQANWRNIHAPHLEKINTDCPLIGRVAAVPGLGAVYARRAGENVNMAKVNQIAKMFMDHQYGSQVTSAPLIGPPGMFAYLYQSDTPACVQQGGVVGDSLAQFCSDASPTRKYCVRFDKGTFAGSTFLVQDIFPEANLYDGGGAYDHGKAGVFLWEVAALEADPQRRASLVASAKAAAQWAMAEVPVANHNYTAKLVWHLARGYGLTGDASYRAAFLDKIERNLKPGILWDENKDGFVDGMSNVKFSQLHKTAQLPGRYWDGHNALPWYHAMNAWALLEGYVALRDAGLAGNADDANEAKKLRPYVIAMLDNLSWEITNLGGAAYELGMRPVVYALALGVWKLAQFEGEGHPSWEKAIWGVWNTGVFNKGGHMTGDAGLLLLLSKGVKYAPARL